MCEAIDSIKLCKCSMKPESIPDWTIRRFEGQNWMDLEMGRCFIPKYSNQELIDATRIKQLLDENDCFDFDYIPMERDVINLTMDYEKTKIEFEFEYVDSSWTIIKSISSHLNKQIVINEGKLKLIKCPTK